MRVNTGKIVETLGDSIVARVRGPVRAEGAPFRPSLQRSQVMSLKN